MIELEGKLAQLKDAIRGAGPVDTDAGPICVLFFSLTDGSERATVHTTTGPTLDVAWESGALLLGDAIADRPHLARWLRIDWVDAVQPVTWGELRQQLETIKRNYFRLGIALDPRFEHAFLETELNANAMLYLGTGQAGAGLNESNFIRYAERRHGLAALDFAAERRVWLFTTRAVFAGEDDAVHRIDGAGLNAGVREFEDVTPDDILAMVRAGSGYLAKEVGKNGRFRYGRHPCFGREIDTYNSLRHASSLLAMIEAWEVAPGDELRASIERCAAYLVLTFVRHKALEGGEDAAWLIDEGDEIKLGGLSAAVLALCKYGEVFASNRYAKLVDRLGTAILSMQDPRTGRFDHVLSFPSLALKQRFRVVYYDGEAAFALLRLFRATGNERWLAAAERAMDYFIAEERWRTHDHWLAYCVDEITQVRPDERYFRLGLQNVADYLDFIRHRITVFPTLLELACATERVLRRLSGSADLQHLLESFDLEGFHDALHARARYLTNGHFWPELAMFFARPDQIVGSFFIRHHAFRVRIDDVEHFLSGLIAYRALLMQPDTRKAQHASKDGGQWSMLNVVQATGGTWIAPPPAGWAASGVSIFAPSFRPGDMIFVRGEGKFGIAPIQEKTLPSAPAAIITDDPRHVREDGVPILSVSSLPKAVLDLGRFARNRFQGAVIGVTGSAGKTTTVAMLAHALRACGEVGQTRFNANLPPGIAWNLASIPWDTPNIVLEMAIGRMRQNAELARPDIAVFTNVLPAHLEFHRDTRTIAARKARIFEGMSVGGTAVLNREMLHFDEVHLAARAHGLKVITYGSVTDSDVRLLHYEPASGSVSATLGGHRIDYDLGAAGHHMALNSLAVIGVATALGHDLDPILDQFASFQPVPGRGTLQKLEIAGAHITVLDDAYNANPGSMAASLALVSTMRSQGRKIAVLGEMLELGEHAASYHSDLAPLIERHGIDQAYLIGGLYAECWARLPENQRGIHADTLEEMAAALKENLRHGDLLMIKGSHGSGVHTLLASLQSSAPARLQEKT